jgi:hypothetical protein
MASGKDISHEEIDQKRFWSLVERGDACWMWRGATAKGGYGLFLSNRRRIQAHRVAWALSNKTSPGKLCVCHSCDTPGCVNPAHLWLGTFEENMADMVAKGRAKTGPADRSGENNGRARLTEQDVRAIRASADSMPRLARQYSVGISTINHIKQRNSWKRVF